jgi:hypothetical protein
LGGHALGQTGGVPATPARTATDAPAAGTASVTSDTKALPWKFVAKPMGALDAHQWNPVLTHFDCDDAPKCPMPDDGTFTALFKATIGERELRRSKPIYVVLHVVQYPEAVKDGSSSSSPDLPSEAISDHWYLYRSAHSHYGDPRWTYEKFTGQRIYGASSVFFLFLHVNAGVITLQNATQQVKNMIRLSKGVAADSATTKEQSERDTQIKADLDAAKFTDALKQLPDLSDSQMGTMITANDLKTPSGDLHFCEAANGDGFTWLGPSGISSTYSRIRYEAAVVKRTPANVENLKTILGLLFGGVAHGKDRSCLNVVANDVLWGAGRIDNIGMPSDISIAGYSVKDADKPVPEADRSSAQIGKTGSYNDEQLYWWDASIGIPVHKIKDLQYSDSDNTVTATQVDKQSAYAMFNLMIHPVDLSNPADNVWPRILVGFPLSSSPWDKLFAGGAIGLPLKPFRNFQFFAGATFLRTKQPASLTAGDSATSAQLQNDLKIKTTPKFTFGINVPVKSVIDKLK